ncbi:MAG: hypothetical protein JRD05_07500 [Deltaproteobacteria bacterium]|nr:hypothetical protein [Deltaproteobacteria bacterium]
MSLSKRSVDPAYRGPVGLADRTGVVNPPEADRLPPLKVRDLLLDLEQISGDFEIEHFETGSREKINEVE